MLHLTELLQKMEERSFGMRQEQYTYASIQLKLGDMSRVLCRPMVMAPIKASFSGGMRGPSFVGQLSVSECFACIITMSGGCLVA